ncbi:gamma-glutamylcyclotransferase [Limibaculum sp. M0105]|uniref:glutathione-specific gamma-glutamylcyclotransferase n=1 Tax=Thermohalobaculum xanthum TaxID=2753746 RepID=A0A8J7MB08_9RHOB|nr:gamma-glutamylcyclotransferase [Thermohalobaculum xanthum]MBK0400983.1 gamma-glutamylcyclotransferase [Thermohalobaculum xanthum]
MTEKAQGPAAEGAKPRRNASRRPLALTAELVALVERQVPDPGIEAGYAPLTDDDFDSFAHALLGQNDGAPIWLFAYGSLIWKPDFDHVDHFACRAIGWRRSYCLHDLRWRASPDAPGLIMALDRGGSCNGVAYRLPSGNDHAQLLRLLRRETAYQGDFDSVRWITVRGREKAVRALVFWAGPRKDPSYLRLPLEAQAVRLARASGHLGSAAAYLQETVVHLQSFGIYDAYLWTLQEMVASEIRRLHHAED